MLADRPAFFPGKRVWSRGPSEHEAMYTPPQRQPGGHPQPLRTHALAWLWASVLTAVSAPVLGCVHTHGCRGQKLTMNVFLDNSPPNLMRQDSSVNPEFTNSAS